MAVDVSRFVTPEQDFEQLNRVGETLDTQKQRQLVRAEQERKDDEVKRGKTAASMRFFTNYLDPKDRYTGTYYDPKMNEYLGQALSQAYELAGKGSGESEILTAISPLINKANDYQQKAKVYSENKKQLLASLGKKKGYNTEALSNLLDKELFEGQDIDKVDPYNLVNALSNIFDKYGAEITNDEAIDELVKELPKSKSTVRVKHFNSRGGYQKSDAMVDMPNIFVQDDEEGETKFVPKYDKATDAGEIIVGDFVDEKGKPVKAPVRLLEEGTFNSIIESNPAVKHRVEALVNNAIRSGKYADESGKPITLDSPQARNLGRALMYDMLKQKARVESNVLQENKPAQIKNITNINSTKEPEKIDLREYPDVKNGKDITNLMQGVKVTGLPTGKSLLAEYVHYDPNTQKVTYKEYTEKGVDYKYGVGVEKTVSLTKFLQDVKTNNPQTDLKFLEGLRNSVTGQAQPQPQPAKKEIKRSDIATKAVAAGYSVKEYEALLIKNGVKIIN